MSLCPGFPGTVSVYMHGPDIIGSSTPFTLSGALIWAINYMAPWLALKSPLFTTSDFSTTLYSAYQSVTKISVYSLFFNKGISTCTM